MSEAVLVSLCIHAVLAGSFKFVHLIACLHHSISSSTSTALAMVMTICNKGQCLEVSYLCNLNILAFPQVSGQCMAGSTCLYRMYAP